VRYLLDTNACIGFLTGRALGVLRHVAPLPPTDIAVCSVVKAELFCGAARSTAPERTLATQREFLERFVSLDFDDRAAEVAGRIRAELAERGEPIGPHDLQIAAIAIANDLTLVTRNVREFGRVNGLRVENWEETG
jgi:tRNA(fMet)-specific endonuclease VapC